MKRLMVIALSGALSACGAPSKPAVDPAGGGPASSGAPFGTACDASRGKVEQLYRSEAKAPDPARVDEIVSDNTTMVMNDCARAPDKVTACIAAATTVRELEARCLAPIDDEGTEGDQLR